LRRVPIRLKLAAALAIPLIALGVVTMFEVAQAARDAREVRSQTELATATIGPQGLTTALQAERTWPALELVGYGGSLDLKVSGYPDTRAAADKAIREFKDQIEGKDVRIRDAFAPALKTLDDNLAQLRADIDASTTPRDSTNIAFSQSIFDRYTAIISPLFDAVTRISLVVNDPDLRQGTELADTGARQVEVLSIMLSGTSTTAYLSPGGIDTPAEITQISSWQETFTRNAEIMGTPAGAYRELAEKYYPAELTDSVNAMIDTALTTHTVNLDQVIAATNVPYEKGYQVYQDKVGAAISVRADQLNAAAKARELWFVVLAALVLGSAALLTYVVSRSITKPLRSLTLQAKDMAEHRLPDAVLDILQTPLGDDVVVPRVEPVAVNTRDEVADVADALNIVQDTALDLAVEQAVLRRNIADSFVNLGRRNQNLLGRQLDFITELETNETDPDTLANLFRLDHLATRMRRNAESLLVLAGIEPPRKWAAPVRLTDVIRAALGEVEDYQRVTVRGVEPATILGSAAADLAHLLAELIENALVFSPPDQTVDIRGRTRPTPAADTAPPTSGYTLAIIDSGLGMPATDVTAANRRLAGAESFTIAPSKYLGHYVAGNLAARHHITVHLDNSPGNGITATIDIPPTLLTSDHGLADPLTPPHGLVDPITPPQLVDAPAPPAPSAPAGHQRTPSGLARRASRPTPGTTIGATQPSGAFLDSLSRHANNHPTPHTPDTNGRAGPRDADPPAAREGRTEAPWPAPDPALTARPGPADVPRTTQSPAPTPVPPWEAPGGGQSWASTPAPPDWEPPGPVSPRVAEPPTADTTSGGLTRRVQGAQLPTTEPRRVRRPTAETPTVLTGNGRGTAGRPAEQRQSADDVYSFLTNFTAGVQRGLDDSGDGDDGAGAS
jgi:signal transduction histidine kinase